MASADSATRRVRGAGLGVHRLILRPRRDLDEAALVEHVCRTGETLVGSV